MRTLLLWPAFGEEYSKYPPLGIAYIAAVLRENDFSVEIIDAAKYGNNKEFEIELREKSPDVLGISVPSVYYEKALEAARIAKKALPHVTVVFGGPHPTVLPEETLKNPEVDIVVYGEGEIKFLNLLKAIQEKTGINRVKGIYYKVDGEILKTPDDEYISNLDSIPFPARDLLPMKEYLRQAPTLPLPYPSTSIVPSRGCYGNCRFCQPSLRKLFGRGIRYRSLKNVVDEIVFLKDRYKVKGLFFADDEPTWAKEWMMAFCEEIKRRKVKIKWICPSRVDTIDREMLTAMKEAGCIQIGFGVESGSRRVLRYYRKGVKPEQIAPVFAMCNQIGIIARANIMIGAPSETGEDVQDTIRLIERIKPDLIAISVTTPIVGTDLFFDAKEKNLLRIESLSGYNRFDIGTMKRELSDLEIKHWIKRMVRTYRREIMKIILNPISLYRRRHLFYHVFVHWFTMLQNPLGLIKDISYYLNYANKERMEERSMNLSFRLPT